ncbi:cobyric acid synthase [Wenxinia marina]|uniref:Cobyric acid synthase n=1 Tax=Wenxinia marina DSM 24838 TaxID=1123501 RepID=A0A0D0P9U0_9RHOB|nr:cobyric acid synthase [Wenxinia marina]KIQ68276.1 adenosylcobyric acid synthase (glutamine-hydrolysing) [Wenxinia marina DSM 24838]GGL79365.1 cobyric acid synthase [Wenxinia marina]
MARAIMIQGAGSNVGKSLIVAGLARAALRRGLSVAPFKPQNMSNNAAVTEDGGEIGRAQALQARAAGRAPLTDMNPVLLKPESEVGAQVVVQGRRVATVAARDYAALKPSLMAPVLDSFRRLAATADLVVVEGAGSPAEVNLRAGDIANMGFAEAAGVPVILAGDIDRGGVIAQLVGTAAVLDPADRARIRGFLVNKFRGDPSLFADGVTAIADHTGWRPLGVLPWFADAWRLPAEDILDIASRPGGALRIAVPRLGRIANFDDLDPLSADPGVTVEIVPPGRALPGDANLILIPGSKSTIADLALIRREGWDIDIRAHLRRGGRVLGICGGYQMLGRRVADPGGIEGPPGTVEGLGLLDVETVMRPEKRLSITAAHEVASGEAVEGYEIHIGETTGPDTARAWLRVDGRPEGAASPDGLVAGCYLHGLFAADGFRRAYLARLGAAPEAGPGYWAGVETVLDALAAQMEAALDVDAILALAGEVS